MSHAANYKCICHKLALHLPEYNMIYIYMHVCKISTSKENTYLRSSENTVQESIEYLGKRIIDTKNLQC